MLDRRIEHKHKPSLPMAECLAVALSVRAPGGEKSPLFHPSNSDLAGLLLIRMGEKFYVGDGGVVSI